MRFTRLLFCAAFVISNQVGLAAQAPVSVPGPETRTYDVFVDNKPAGNYKLVLSPAADGTFQVESTCNVHFSVFFIDYKYSYHGHEVWKDDHLQSLQSDSVDGGKKIHLIASNGPEGLKYTVNGKKERVAGADTLPSSYWHLVPPLGGASASAKFLEVDSGRLFKANFKKIGEEKLSVGGQQEACEHYQLSGEDDGDLWYDASQRLVRQASESDGHKTVVQLKSRN